MPVCDDVPVSPPQPLHLKLLWLAFLVPLLWSTGADADLFFHVLTGLHILAEGAIPPTDQWSFTAAGNLWMNHQWLTQVLLAWVWQHGGNAGLLVFRGIVLAVTAGTMGAAIWKRCPSPFWSTLLVVFPFGIYSRLINLRPQGISYLGVALVIGILTSIRRERTWPLLALFLLFPLWANMHAGFPFGLGIMGAGVFALSVRGTLNKPRTLALLLLPGMLTLLNPYGINLWQYIFKEFGAPHIDLPEWNPPEGILLFITLGTIILPAIAAWKRRAPLRFEEWFGLVCSVFMTLRGARFIIFAVMFSSITLATALGHRQGQPQQSAVPRWDERLPALLVLVISLLAFQLPFIGRPGRVAIDAKRYPIASVRFLRESNARCRLWCPLGWGGIVLFHLSDHVRVSLDGRNTTVYPIHFVVEQTKAVFSGNLEPVIALKPDAVLVESHGPLYEALLQHPNFLRVQTDPVSSIFTRQGFDLHPTIQISSPTMDFPW
ncbi:MAG TPA: hypothetical protein PKM25_07195 [Candidatus Ozemobacteraceae bacterium]|nr:hypothetical protein [Candidatus Ozemobacteraceae bacterium]